jgi:hypothetical protein
MFKKSSTVALMASALGTAALVACAVQTPLTPTPPGGSGSTAAPDGTTLKVGAPTLVSPVNDVIVAIQRPTLTISRASGLFANQTFQYEFELQSDTGTVLTRGTVNDVSFTVPDNLANNQAFMWRARAVLNGAVGPYSALGRFQSPRLNTPTERNSDTDWRLWFEALRATRGVGPTLTVQALLTLDPDLKAANVIQETNSAGQPRGRLYLPTGSSTNLYGRTVDLGDFGGPWQWISRGFTTCEGGSCR